MNENNKIRVLHVIAGLRRAGAELILKDLASRLNSNRFKVVVISLSGEGALVEDFREEGINLHFLNMKPNIFFVVKLFHLYRLIKKEKPDIIHSWMYHADLVVSIISMLSFRNVEIIWSIHHEDPSKNKRLTKWVAAICAKLSWHIPIKIVVCSISALSKHREFGYSFRRMKVIENGIDMDRFNFGPKPLLRLARPFTVGHLGRWHIIKNQKDFICAAAIVLKKHPEIKFSMAGSEISDENGELNDLIVDAGVVGAVCLLGECEDVPSFLRNIDIMVSSSLSESFGLVLVEAMASGVPCVSTDVGIARDLIGNTGEVVPLNRPEQLAQAIINIYLMSQLERENLGTEARCRVVQRFDIDRMVLDYQHLYEEIATCPL